VIEIKKNTKRHLANSVFKIVLSTKLPLLIYYNKMTLQNLNNECNVDMIKSTSKLVGEGILTVNNILNKAPQKKLDNTPYEL